MASEQKIRQVLDLLTTPQLKLESLNFSIDSRAKSLREIARSSNIVAMGISEKRSANESTGKLALTFYVKKKVPLQDLMGDQAIPPTVPDVFTGDIAIPTDVVEIGEVLPQVNAIRSPIQPGNSIGHYLVSAGTLGAIVTDGEHFFALSNSHVLAENGSASKGDAILYPGSADGGANPSDQIGKLHDFVPFIPGTAYLNKVDCAIARIGPEQLTKVKVVIKGKGIPKGIIKAKRGMKVYKVGRTTEYTEGVVRDVDVRIILPYGGILGDLYFTNQVLCDNFTDSGDSGALVLDKKTDKAVGLHFCGSSVASMFNPIGFVLEELNIKLAATEISKYKRKMAVKAVQNTD